MSRPRITTPHACLHFGIAQRDATPPVGIFHRFWGAANHDVATGVHRPVRVMATAFGDNSDPQNCSVLVTSDHCLLRPTDMARMRQAVVAAYPGISDSRLTFSFGHSHSAGHICSERANQPGGDMIASYLDTLQERTLEAVRDATETLTPARALFAHTDCDMAAHRDFQDPSDDQFVCGFNPANNWAFPVHVVRMRSMEGQDLGSLVTYPCHPTTLAWENTLISPDYIGAMRETIESGTGAPCQFLLAPCGDIGPRHGFVGDVSVADSNGTRVGHAALAAWHSLDHSEGDFAYQGPVLSGATLGEWRFQGWAADKTPLSHERFHVPLAYRTDLRDIESIESELRDWEQQSQDANASKPDRAGTARAMAERCRREWERVAPLPPGDSYPLQVDILRCGDADIVLVEGEPYHQLQRDLQDAFPDREIIVGVLSDGSRCSYLPTEDSFNKPLYQVQVSLLAAGCLERLRDAIIERLSTSC